MAIDAEDILVCLWRFLRFFVNTSYFCAQKHPFVSCMFLLFFLVYVFFNLLVYHFPFLICVAVLLRFFWTSEHTAIQEVKEEKDNEKAKAKEEENQRKPLKISRSVDDQASKNCESPSLRKQKSRRTRVKPKENNNVEWNNFAQVGKEENELLFPLSIDKRSWSFEHGETLSTGYDVFRADEQHRAVTDGEITKLDEHLFPCELGKSDGNGVVLEADIAEDIAEDEEEEEEHEGVDNKAVEWTEDDQKNLVDLGLSEIERNRRLESLIAKRRARKLIKNQPEKSLIDLESAPPSSSSQIPAPIFVARSNPFEAPTMANEIEGLQVPGSAPSILLPTQNPFDLPYDPLEEKPNLMTDSFTQEFTAVNQKEMTFCRHESFTLGPFQFDAEQDRRDSKFSTFFSSEKGAFDGLGYSRFKKPSGDHDGLIEQLLGVGKSHIDHTPTVVQSEPQSTLQLPNSEMSNFEGDTQTKNAAVSEGEILNDMESANQMDSLSTITEVDTEPSILEDSETTSSSSFEVSNRAEVSIGLEPIHGYVEHDEFSCPIPTTIEPLYDSSPNANDKSRMDDDRMYFREKDAVHTPSCSIASDLQVEVSEKSSPPLTIGNISPTDGDSLSYDDENFDRTSSDDMSQLMEETEIKLKGCSSSDALAHKNPESTMRLAEKLAAHPFFEVLSETTEKSLSQPGESLERNTDVRESVGGTIDDKEDQKKHKGDGREQRSNRQEIEENTGEPAEETESNAQRQNLTEYLSMESAQQIKGGVDLNRKGDGETQSEQDSIADAPKSIEADDISISLEERRDKQSLVESEVTCINQKYEEAIASVEQKESVVREEVLVFQAIASAEQKESVVREEVLVNTPVDGISSSDLDQTRQSMDAPKCNMVDKLHPRLIMPQNELLQELSAPEKFTDEANAISNVSAPIIEDKSGREESETNDDTREAAETHFDIKTGSGSNENIEIVLEELAQKSLSSPDGPIEQNTVYGMVYSAAGIIDDAEDQEKHEEGDGGEQISQRQEIVENMQELDADTESDSNTQGKGDADLNLKGYSETQIEQVSAMESPKSLESEHNLIRTEERNDEQSSIESEVSCIKPKYEEAIPSTEQREQIVEEEVLVNSSSSSFPTAATINQITVDEVSSSNIDQIAQSMDASKSDTEDVIQSSSQEEQLPDLTSLIKSSNEENVVEYSPTHLSNISYAETLQIGQEPSALEKFTDEAKSGIEKSESNKDTNEEEEDEEEKDEELAPINPEAAAELSETPAESGSASN